MAKKKDLERRIANLEALVAALSAQVAQPRTLIYPATPWPDTYPKITCDSSPNTNPSAMTVRVSGRKRVA